MDKEDVAEAKAGKPSSPAEEKAEKGKKKKPSNKNYSADSVMMAKNSMMGGK